MRTHHLVLTLMASLFLGCAGKTEDDVQQDSAAEPWVQEDVDESGDEPGAPGSDDDEGDKPEGEDGDDKPEGENGDVKECDDDFDPDEPCEGDYTTTMCMYDGMYWWCEGGVWLNEDDKP